MRKDINKIFEEIEKAAGKSKAEKLEVGLEDLGAGLATKMKEDLEMWLPDASDTTKWVLEEPLDKKNMKIPEMPLPRALEDMIGDLLQPGVKPNATRVLPQLLLRFGRAHPAVRIELQTGLTEDMLERLGVAYDVVLGIQPVGTGRGIIIRRDAPVWVAGPAARAPIEDPLPLALYPD